MHSFDSGVLWMQGFWEQSSDRRGFPVSLVSILFPLTTYKLDTRLLGGMEWYRRYKDPLSDTKIRGTSDFSFQLR